MRRFFLIFSVCCLVFGLPLFFFTKIWWVGPLVAFPLAGLYAIISPAPLSYGKKEGGGYGPEGGSVYPPNLYEGDYGDGGGDGGGD